MAQSLAKIYIHIVFHIKNDGIHIENNDRNDLYSYMAGTLNQCESTAIKINGTHNHIHILCVLSKNIAISNLVKTLKVSSCKWLKSRHQRYYNFSWQTGYGAFSVSQSQLSRTVQYISNQEEHHRAKTFAEEYLEFLKKYEVDYNEDYILTD